MAHKIEVFTAECPLCSETLEVVRESTEDCGCEVIERRCEGDECCEPAKEYGIKAVPTIVIDGKIEHVGKPPLEDVENLIG